jgi:2-polyprenyl-3-methyl-5-hydroxy-6-metoxy-1,4-benzoquinol methylase
MTSRSHLAGVSPSAGVVDVVLAGAVSTVPEASVIQRADGGCEISTPLAPWSYAVVVPLGNPESADEAIGTRLEIELEINSGSVGMFVTNDTSAEPISREVVQEAGGGRITLRIDGSRETSRLWVRSGPRGNARATLYRVRRVTRRTFDITAVLDAVLPEMLRSPGEAAIQTVAAALSEQFGHPVVADEIGALTCRRAPINVPFDELFTDQPGRVVVDAADALISLMPTYDPSKMDPRDGYLGREYFKTYLRQSTTRVYHLIERLRASGVIGGSVLDVGALFGQFAMPLQHLGFKVTAVDRYRGYSGAFDGYTASMRAAGICVVETDRSDEQAFLEALGQFDVVLCMAVIEHVPHTPRELLRALVSHVAPGGVLALDTPNVASYWNRKRLAQGHSIFQPIEDQFFSEIPYEGHHREYTASEMEWMLKQVGCRRVTTSLFDYNLLQFDELTREHIDALLAMSLDATLADTILVAGTVGSDRRMAPSNAVV